MHLFWVQSISPQLEINFFLAAGSRIEGKYNVGDVSRKFWGGGRMHAYVK